MKLPTKPPIVPKVHFTLFQLSKGFLSVFFLAFQNHCSGPNLVQKRCEKIAMDFLLFFPGLLVSGVLMDTGARKRMTDLRMCWADRIVSPVQRTCGLL